MPEDLLVCVQQCAESRSSVCEKELRRSEEEGKNILTAVFNGSKLPDGLENNEFLKRLQKAARYMRWLAVSLAPGIYELCSADPDRTFPMASTFTFVWNAVEDYVLTAIIQFFLFDMLFAASVFAL